MRCLLTHIHQLVHGAPAGVTFRRGADMAKLETLSDAWLLVENGCIHSFGPMTESPPAADETTDCTGRLVLPGFVDSHTHLVFARSREEEFVDRLRGLTYEEIARNGGGILNSARRLQAATEDELFESASLRVQEVVRQGTTALEIKSGYGLTVADELKMLRVIRRLKAQGPVPIRATLLGAHALPLEFRDRRADYIRLVCKDLIPQAAAEGLADYVDVFCETGFFTPEETDVILETGARYGLKGRVHANELDYSGGVEAGVRQGALSVDHLECVGEAQIEALRGGTTIPTLLPATAFFLGLEYAPARRMIDAGLGVALASDFNPGTAPSGNMAFVLALACIRMKLLPEEALTAATLNAAAALEWADEMGSLAPGKAANLLVTTPLPSLHAVPYYFGSSLVARVMVGGRWA